MKLETLSFFTSAVSHVLLDAMHFFEPARHKHPCAGGTALVGQSDEIMEKVSLLHTDHEDIQDAAVELVLQSEFAGSGCGYSLSQSFGRLAL